MPGSPLSLTLSRLDHTHSLPNSMCVHALLFNLLVMSTFVLLFAMKVMSLPTVKKFSGHHLIFATILIFKHATFLRLDGLSYESALTQAELDYREANIDLKIRQHLRGSFQNSVEVSASFLMATDIGSFTFAFVKLISSRF
ncbi:hypothetical protein EDB83DRAFT_1785115 [Lactarius deliciosus]|nr:hypothetical protein EDB83DRAFT_1785115 [Lactarius deliciosus]